MATTTITITLEHGEATPDVVSRATPAILHELAEMLAGLGLQTPTDRGRIRARDLQGVTGFRAAWTAVTK